MPSHAGDSYGLILYPIRAIHGITQYFIISRWEYIPAGIPIVCIPTLLAISSFAEVSINITYLLAGALVWYLSHFLGSQANCLSDYELDKNYGRAGIIYKSGFPKAIDVIGKKKCIQNNYFGSNYNINYRSMVNIFPKENYTFRIVAFWFGFSNSILSRAFSF